MGKTRTHKDMLEDEWYHVRHSGEIPEIALHSSIHFLAEDQEGPQLILDDEDHALLSSAALQRYREIILRDITPKNRDTTIYRGVLRSIANWRRLKRFCQRHDLAVDTIRQELPDLFRSFLENEIAEVQNGTRQSSINCTFEDLSSFALELDLSLDDIEPDLRPICLDF